MDVTRRTDYSIRLMSALVANEGEPLSVRLAAEEYGVPYSFARSIQHVLTLEGLINSKRGAQGGMILACDPEKTTLFDIITAVQGSVSVSDCSCNEDYCSRSSHCNFHRLFCGVDKLVSAYLKSVTLAELSREEIDPLEAALAGEALLSNFHYSDSLVSVPDMPPIESYSLA